MQVPTYLVIVFILYVSDLRTNLISISKITDKGHSVVFNKTNANILDTNGDVLISAKREGGLYYLQKPSHPECKNVVENDVQSPKKNSLHDWLVRMGHLNAQSLREAIKTGTVQGIKVNDINENI